MTTTSTTRGPDIVTAFLEAVSAVERGTKDPSLSVEEFEDLVAEREGLRREIRNRLLGV
ncbi:hypothetical protein [Nocardioides sp.]|uniref:hypothetical protein n=1 Tax=Nocardioides sp. TaxID=35761 RepID=UPI00262DD596|nr:hypothetical protein [Nocardioides sp.]MDI6911513.1 hypothetical protein [Nocardioides sp.]